MSDLTEFRDHARRMARLSKPITRMSTQVVSDGDGRMGVERVEVVLAGVPSDAERALWTRLADEIDEYLTDDEDQQLALEEHP